MPLKTTRALLVLFLLLSSLQFVSAQSNPRSRNGDFSLSVGYTSNFSNRDGEGNGFQVGVNLYRSSAYKISYDAQLSVSVGSGDVRRITPLSVIGVRYYLSPPEKPVRIFVNALAGLALQFRQIDNKTDTTPDLGYSIGAYVESRRFIYGASIESPENFVVKVGFII